RRVMHRPTLTAVALLLAAAPAFAQTSEEVEKKILDEVNAYRVKKGSPKLVVDDKLVAIAQAHAQGMAKADKLGDAGKNGHGWDGKNTTERLEAAGYKSALATENVGSQTRPKDPAGALVKAWLSAPGPEKNLVNKDFTLVGIGAAKSKSGKWYYVQLLAKPAVAKPVVRTITATIENKTNQTISFRVGKDKFEMKAGQAGEITHTTSSSKSQIAVTWPDSKKEELFDLADKASYAFTQKEKDKFAFEKTSADEKKDAKKKDKDPLTSRTIDD